MTTDRGSPIPPAYDGITYQSTPSCLNCRHLERSSMSRCTAYPDGIPYPILSGEVRHDRPVAGDNGIQYEVADDAPDPRPVEWLTLRR